jgi:hypothetical protein
MPPVVRQLGERLDDIGWVTDLLVAGSLATGDYVPGVSDLDLVALTEGPVDSSRQETLASLHRDASRACPARVRCPGPPAKRFAAGDDL